MNRRGPRIVRQLAETVSRDRYDETTQEIAQLIYDRRMGFGAVHFRRPRDRREFDHFDLPYTARYGTLAEPIRIYGTALWQADPLSEFMHYYRIVERTGGGNGKAWIINNVQRIAAYDFGRLYFEVSLTGGTLVNVFSTWRRRAVNRVRQLGLTNGDLAKYLYNTTRCGIAHGNTGVITLDFGSAIATAAKDLPLMKLLARLAIDDQIPAAARRPPSEDGRPGT